MSTLTKVLIVLLTVFSLFLSGIVATYVGASENWYKKAKDNEQRLSTATKSRESADRAKEEADKGLEAVKADLGQKLADRDTQIAKLQTDLDTAKRMNDQLQQKVASMADVMANTSATVKQQTGLHEAAQQKVTALEAQRINHEKELEELNRALLEKVTLLAQHENTIRRLTQENQDLGTRLDQYLVRYGKSTTQPPTTVAPGSMGVRPVQPVAMPLPQTKNIALNAQITAVDLKSRLVEISIGTAAGVRQDMVFYITRGDQSVADIQVVEVWPDKAVGILVLGKPGVQPQVGDKVATNL